MGSRLETRPFRSIAALSFVVNNFLFCFFICLFSCVAISGRLKTQLAPTDEERNKRKRRRRWPNRGKCLVANAAIQCPSWPTTIRVAVRIAKAPDARTRPRTCTPGRFIVKISTRISPIRRWAATRRRRYLTATSSWIRRPSSRSWTTQSAAPNPSCPATPTPTSSSDCLAWWPVPDGRNPADTIPVTTAPRRWWGPEEITCPRVILTSGRTSSPATRTRRLSTLNGRENSVEWRASARPTSSQVCRRHSFIGHVHSIVHTWAFLISPGS